MCKRSQQRGATRTRTGPRKSQFWIEAGPESPGNPASSSGAAWYGPLRSWVVQSVLRVSSVMYPAEVSSFLCTKYSQPSGIARFCASFIALDSGASVPSKVNVANHTRSSNVPCTENSAWCELFWVANASSDRHQASSIALLGRPPRTYRQDDFLIERSMCLLVESLPRVASIRFGYFRFSRVALVDEDAVAESQ